MTVGNTMGWFSVMKTFATFILTALLNVAALGATTDSITLQAEDGKLNSSRVEVVEQKSFKDGRGVSLKGEAEPAVEVDDAAPDIVFAVQPEEAGTYIIRSHAAVDTAGRAIMEKAKTKYESLFLKIAVDNSRPTKRVVFVPWSGPDSYGETLGKFHLSAGAQEIRVWLPKNVRLDYLQIIPYVPPKVPVAAADYRPEIVPPNSRPRLWVNEQTLAEVQANLTKGEHAKIWKEVQELANRPYSFNPEAGSAIDYNADLETTAVTKAFVYLMTGDEAAGRDAIKLVRNYLSAVEFGNLLDITREIGRAIYAGARVYDWCYDLMTEEDRTSIRKDLMRLADDMEIGWPPFKQGVVNGHGSEAQLHCHLLSMAIAIYDEDPLPYQYCAYRILEELVPMRNFEYQSPRHNQGIGYGIYRFGWDMHAAWLLYRMSGQKVFDSNIEDVHTYWLYMRLPNGESFPDGDGNVDGRRIKLGATSLLTSAYAKNPLYKMDFEQQGGLPGDPLMVLLLNDPELAAADDLTSLPLTLDFGPVLGGMVARTGWNMGKDSSDVLVAMTGGGYHFANHQHADAGSFQIYYRGIQVADLGQYVFYGTPYDINFNKRSIAHSMMLAYDPNEKMKSSKFLNDGGTRYGFSSPASVLDVTGKPVYANGTILASDFGPSPEKPQFSFYSVDLTSAYGEKLRKYVRTFCFLNLQEPETPAALIVVDHMETSGPEVKKYWQVNTLNPPKQTSSGLVLTNSAGGRNGHVILDTIKPGPEARTMEVHSGRAASTVFGHELTPPKPDAPQANGHRVMISPKDPQVADTFLTVMTMSDSETGNLPVDVVETPEAFVMTLAARVIVLSKTGKQITDKLTVDVSGAGESQLLLTGIKPGGWTIKSPDGGFHQSVQVEEKQNTAHLLVPKGQYQVEPSN